MGGLLDRVASREELSAAWERVLANDAEDDVLSEGVRSFAEDVEARLSELGAQLREGTYAPQPLTEVAIPKSDGGERVLRIPSVRDRVVERALLGVLTPVVDPVLGPSCYGCRPGLGVADAVQAVARLRDEGFGWVLRTDVHDCFSHVDVQRVRRLLDVLVPDRELVALVGLLLARPAIRAGRKRRGTGRGATSGLAAFADAGEPGAGAFRRTAALCGVSGGSLRR